MIRPIILCINLLTVSVLFASDGDMEFVVFPEAVQTVTVSPFNRVKKSDDKHIRSILKHSACCAKAVSKNSLVEARIGVGDEHVVLQDLQELIDTSENGLENGKTSFATSRRQNLAKMFEASQGDPSFLQKCLDSLTDRHDYDSEAEMAQIRKSPKAVLDRGKTKNHSQNSAPCSLPPFSATLIEKKSEKDREHRQVLEQTIQRSLMLTQEEMSRLVNEDDCCCF